MKLSYPVFKCAEYHSTRIETEWHPESGNITKVAVVAYISPAKYDLPLLCGTCVTKSYLGILTRTRRRKQMFEVLFTSNQEAT
jgi:hypothetical protein